MATIRKLGRAFNHLEDLVFFYGVAGAREAIDHLLEITDDSSTVRMKWDGGAQVYWGREYAGGPFIMTSHNGWAKGYKATTKEELYDFIVHQSGAAKSDVEIASRVDFAKDFIKCFAIFEEATPKDFVGFVYGDTLFTSKPPMEKTRFKIVPNTRTYYTVPRKSELGKQINKAEVMVVGHAIFTEFGAKDDKQIPKDDFSEFGSKKLVVINPYYTQTKLRPINEEAANLIEFINEHAATLEGFLEDTPGMTMFRTNIYSYTCRKARQKRLNRLGDDFLEWFVESKISNKKLRLIKSRMEQYPQGLQVMVRIIKYIIHLKNDIIDQLETKLDSGMRVYNAEGWVRYADTTKQFGNVKFVPRHKWHPHHENR